MGWGQSFLRQVSVASLQMQSWQSTLMVWPGYGGMTREPDLCRSCSAQGPLYIDKPHVQAPTGAEELCSKPGESGSEVQGLRH